MSPTDLLRFMCSFIFMYLLLYLRLFETFLNWINASLILEGGSL